MKKKPAKLSIPEPDTSTVFVSPNTSPLSSPRPLNVKLSEVTQKNDRDEKFVNHLKENNWCGDCGDHIQWASRYFGITLCMRCSGGHRGLGGGESKVTSLSIDDWSVEDIQAFIEKGGNKALNEKVLPSIPSYKLSPETPGPIRNHFIACKWFGETWDFAKASSLVKDTQEQVCINAGILKLELLSAKNLKVADIDGKSDPFCVIRSGRFKEKKLKTSKTQSTVKKNTLNPVWNETFMLNIAKPEDGVTIQGSVL